jgi:hypothetical protein
VAWDWGGEEGEQCLGVQALIRSTVCMVAQAVASLGGGCRGAAGFVTSGIAGVVAVEGAQGPIRARNTDPGHLVHDCCARSDPDP